MNEITRYIPIIPIFMQYGGGTLRAPTSHSGAKNVVGDSVSLRLCYKVVVCANISPVKCHVLNSEMARRKVIPLSYTVIKLL